MLGKGWSETSECIEIRKPLGSCTAVFLEMNFESLVGLQKQSDHTSAQHAPQKGQKLLEIC